MKKSKDGKGAQQPKSIFESQSDITLLDSTLHHFNQELESENIREEYKKALRYFSKEAIEGYEEVFRVFDVDDSKTIDAEELICVFNSLGQKMTMVEVEDMILDVDQDDNMEVDIEEFIVLMYRAVHDKKGLANLEKAVDIAQRRRNMTGLTLDGALNHLKERNMYKCIVFAVDVKTQVCFVDSFIYSRNMVKKYSDISVTRRNPFEGHLPKKALEQVFKHFSFREVTQNFPHVNYAWYEAASSDKLWKNYYYEFMKGKGRSVNRTISRNYKGEYKNEFFSYDWEEMVYDLPEKECRMILYNLEYTANTDRRLKYVFLHWSPPFSSVGEELICQNLKPLVLKKIRETVGDNIVVIRSCDKRDLKTHSVIIKCIRADQRDLVKRVKKNRSNRYKTMVNDKFVKNYYYNM